MIKEEIIKKLIKDKNYAEYLCAVNLSEYDVATLVCHAPVSLFEKQSIYKELIAERPRERVPSDERFVYENYLRAAVRATEDLKLSKDKIFLLAAHSFEDGHDERFEGMSLRSYGAAQKYLREILGGGEENTWYTLEKRLTDGEDEDPLGRTVCEFTFIGPELCFYKNLRYFYDKEFRKKHRRQMLIENDFTLFSSGNDLNLPTPFRQGDELRIDCRPFAPETIVTVTDNHAEYDCCNPQCEYIGENGERKYGALKHSRIFNDDVLECISPLYNLEWIKKNQ